MPKLCALFGALIADGEQLYDPCQYPNRPLLGFSGMMSEAELHQPKMRLHTGRRQKAERGERRLLLPAGRAVILHPDEEVAAVAGSGTPTSSFGNPQREPGARHFV